MSELLPWHAAAWQKVIHQTEQGQLPHAFLVCAPPGTGGAVFTEALAARMICSEPAKGAQACGQCQDCHLFHERTHADCIYLQPESAGKAIPVDEVRKIGPFAAQSSMRRDVSVVVIQQAEAMNHSAANALLKTLEEPRPGVHLILSTTAPGRLLPTLRSRCQRLTLPSPDAGQARDYLTARLEKPAEVEDLLRMTGNAPLAALEIAQDNTLDSRRNFARGLVGLEKGNVSPVQLARDTADLPLTDVLDMLYRRLARRQRDALGTTLATTLGQALVPAFDRVLEARRAIWSASNPNRDLLLESILIQWPGISARARTGANR